MINLLNGPYLSIGNRIPVGAGTGTDSSVAGSTASRSVRLFLSVTSRNWLWTNTGVSNQNQERSYGIWIWKGCCGPYNSMGRFSIRRYGPGTVYTSYGSRTVSGGYKKLSLLLVSVLMVQAKQLVQQLLVNCLVLVHSYSIHCFN